MYLISVYTLLNKDSAKLSIHPKNFLKRLYNNFFSPGTTPRIGDLLFDYFRESRATTAGIGIVRIREAVSTGVDNSVNKCRKFLKIFLKLMLDTHR